MSTSGHYTRYINQYPGYYDNCDTMYHPVFPKIMQNSEPGGLYGFCQFGHLTVEHTAGNKYAFCDFDIRYDQYNYWQWIREQTDYIGPFRSGTGKILIEYAGDKAIQHVLEMAKQITDDQLIDLVFSRVFYNRSYVDYFRYYLNEVDINV
jgi:hypothetical protein